MVVASAEHAQPPSYTILGDGCLVCGGTAKQHKVVWVGSQDEDIDFDALGLIECMLELGADTHHGAWCRYICRIKDEPADTMEREEFEELYGES